MSSQQLLQEPGGKGECGIATLLQTEAVGTGELGDGPQLLGHVGKSSRIVTFARKIHIDGKQN